MRIIQSFNTFEGFKLNGGFVNTSSLLKYLKESYKIHISITEDYCIYTDAYGYELINKVIDPKHITVIEFPNKLYGKLVYEGKFYVQSLQNKEYIHVDLDATLFSIPTKSDVYVEKLRDMVFLGRECSLLNIDQTGIFKIPCSALIGFSDMKLQKLYLEEVYKRFEIIRNIPKCTYVYAYTLEEILLQRLIIDNKKQVFVCDCEHLGNKK